MPTALMWIMGIGGYLSIGALFAWLVGADGDDGGMLIACWPLLLFFVVLCAVLFGVPKLLAMMVAGEDWRGWLREINPRTKVDAPR